MGASTARRVILPRGPPLKLRIDNRGRNMANNTRATARVAMMATAFAAIISFDSACAYPDSATVHTDKGVVRGSVSEDGRQFLGIPYAAPPVGALRWKPPAPVAAWQQPRDATQFASNCPQF